MKNNKTINRTDDKTLETMMKIRRELLNLMLNHEDKFTDEENRALEIAYESYVRFLGKWLDRNGYFNN